MVICMNETEKQEDIRKAGDYIIKQSMKIGGREVVLGENMEDKDGRFYFVADFESNEIFERYTNAFVSNDYVEMAGMFAERITEEIEKLKHNRSDLSMDVITKEACIPINNETFVGKIIVIRPQSLSPEYRNEQYQIVRCTGGNGAKADGLGTSVFCKEMFTGEEVKYRRANVMGILKEEHYPDWLKSKLKDEQNIQKKKKPKEVER